MTTLSIIIGLLVVGVCARFIWPREEAGDFIMMIAFSIAGACVIGSVFLLLWHLIFHDAKLPRFAFIIAMAIFFLAALKGINYVWNKLETIINRIRK
jgi:uncharacterized membrane protein YeaQ/YmgE (transglycosylase-associated protein family)